MVQSLAQRFGEFAGGIESGAWVLGQALEADFFQPRRNARIELSRSRRLGVLYVIQHLLDRTRLERAPSREQRR